MCPIPHTYCPINTPEHICYHVVMRMIWLIWTAWFLASGLVCLIGLCLELAEVHLRGAGVAAASFALATFTGLSALLILSVLGIYGCASYRAEQAHLAWCQDNPDLCQEEKLVNAIAQSQRSFPHVRWEGSDTAVCMPVGRGVVCH